jgi:hypothetical protein
MQQQQQGSLQQEHAGMDFRQELCISATEELDGERSMSPFFQMWASGQGAADPKVL